MREERPRTWAQLMDVLYGGAWNDALRRHRAPFAFRGVSDEAYSLQTSLARLGGDPRDLERHLLRAFRRYAYERARERDSSWHWLALGQHHGLPTRLLDWSYSPLVALHFATANPAHMDRDGVVWMVNFDGTARLLPDELRGCLAEEGSSVFTAELLAECCARAAGGDVAPPGRFDPGVLDALEARANEPFLLFFEPPSLDERIVAQYALFSLLSNPSTPLETWIGTHPDLAVKVVVAAEFKWEVRDKLDQANVSERTLLPGLGGLSAWLRRYYTPRGD